MCIAYGVAQCWVKGIIIRNTRGSACVFYIMMQVLKVTRVYYPGDGKTHYIENELSKVPYYKKIAVNEAFTPLAAIKKLADLPADIPNCAIYFNFTLLPPGVGRVQEMSREECLECSLDSKFALCDSCKR